MADNTVPRAPAGLGTRGRKYWKSIIDSYQLTGSELELLTEACRTMDNLDALAASVARDGVTTAGSAGQTVVHPAVTEARGQRLALHRLISALGLPAEDAIPDAVTIRNRQANVTRWSRSKAL